MNFKNYSNSDYEAVCDFLIELNRKNRNHINWNWGRFEWMMEHPEFDKSLMNSIGIWIDDDRVVGAAIYDMPFYEKLGFKVDIFDYACRCSTLPRRRL